jgi:DNA ligase (NAD+)
MEIEKAGGKVSGSVSAKTSYLINNDLLSNSGKNKKAKELGIQIIDEATIADWIVNGK